MFLLFSPLQMFLLFSLDVSTPPSNHHDLRVGAVLYLFSLLFPDYGGIQEKLSLCKPPSSPQDIYQLNGLLRNAFTLMAMLDYPYSTHFMGHMPANPVKVQRWSRDGPEGTSELPSSRAADAGCHLCGWCSSGGLSDHAEKLGSAP